MMDSDKLISFKNKQITSILELFRELPSAFTEDETLMALLSTLDVYATLDGYKGLVNVGKIVSKVSGDYLRLNFSIIYSDGTPDYSDKYFTRDVPSRTGHFFEILYLRGKKVTDQEGNAEFRRSKSSSDSNQTDVENFDNPRLSVAIVYSIFPFRVGDKTVYSFSLRNPDEISGVVEVATEKTEEKDILLDNSLIIPRTSFGKMLVKQ